MLKENNCISPDISIIIPVYNKEDYIASTIKSVIGEKCLPYIELIFVDGLSTDKSLGIIKEYQKKYPSIIKIISEEDKGQSDAINKGVSIAQADIIGWLNADDLYLSDTLNTVYNIFCNRKINWMIGFCYIINKNQKEIRKFITIYKNIFIKLYSKITLLLENYISQPAVFFKKNFFNEVGGLDTELNYVMDYDLWLKFSLRENPFIVKRYLAAFRWYEESKSGTGYVHQFKEGFTVMKKYSNNKIIHYLHKINYIKIVISYNILKNLNLIKKRK